MRFRRVVLLMLIILGMPCGLTSFASTMYDFTTSESIVINNVPGSSDLDISSLVIVNNGPALSIDSIRAESIGEWSIVSDSETDWAGLSADDKKLGLVCNAVDLSGTALLNQGNIETDNSRTFEFTGHIGPRRLAVTGVAIANIITTVTISDEPTGGTTYVYQDGTLIINEDEGNHESNIETHGAAIACYATYEKGVTEWNNCDNVPWMDSSVRETIEKVEFGSNVSATDMSYWFCGCSNITDIDITNLDCSSCTAMNHTFDSISSIEYIDLCGLDTSNVKSMNGIFADCSSLKRIYIDDSWSTAAVTEGVNVIAGSTSLIGGDGHVYDATADYTQLRYDNYDNPGYLTYNGSDKCIVRYNYAKSGFEFNSDFDNQIKSGDNFSCGGAGSQVKSMSTRKSETITAFRTSRTTKVKYHYTEPCASSGSSMLMYNIYLTDNFI